MTLNASHRESSRPRPIPRRTLRWNRRSIRGPAARGVTTAEPPSENADMWTARESVDERDSTLNESSRIKPRRSVATRAWWRSRRRISKSRQIDHRTTTGEVRHSHNRTRRSDRCGLGRSDEARRRPRHRRDRLQGRFGHVCGHEVTLTARRLRTMKRKTAGHEHRAGSQTSAEVAQHPKRAATFRSS